MDLEGSELGDRKGHYALSWNGECAGVVFPGQADALVFLPHSGDVLVCSANAWLEASQSGFLESTHQLDTPELSEDAEALLATLERLGVNLG